MNPDNFETNRANLIEKKDVAQYVSSFDRHEIKNLHRLEENKPWIMMPNEFYNATIEMCEGNRETRGVFLVPRQGIAVTKGHLPVEAMISIGYGSSTAVFPDEQKLDAINKLLFDYKNDSMPIDFHSHTIETGGAFFNTFSDADNQSLANNVNRRRGYMHVLFTPTNILTFGMGKPDN